MKDPFHRAAMFEILNMAALDPIVNIFKCSYTIENSSPKKKKMKTKPIPLHIIRLKKNKQNLIKSELEELQRFVMFEKLSDYSYDEILFLLKPYSNSSSPDSIPINRLTDIFIKLRISDSLLLYENIIKSTLDPFKSGFIKTSSFVLFIIE